MDEIYKVLENLEIVRKEYGADTIKFYYENDRDYCFKFVKNDKVILVIRRGVNRR